MSRIWENAKKGAKIAATAALVVGGVLTAGSIFLGGAMALEMALTTIVSSAGWGIIGGVIGGAYGAVSDEPTERVVVAQQQAPARAAATAQEMAQDAPASARFQTMVNESRANSANAQR